MEYLADVISPICLRSYMQIEKVQKCLKIEVFKRRDIQKLVKVYLYSKEDEIKT